jgi:hypothetical protein
MAQVQGSTQSVEIDVTGTNNSLQYKSLVCLRTSSVNNTVDTTQDDTNCGILTAVGSPKMSIDFDAICETSPLASQVSYNSLLSAWSTKQKVSVRVQNPTVTGSSAGAAYYHQFDGYITSLTFNQATAEFINFSGTIESTGNIDVIA